MEYRANFFMWIFLSAIWVIVQVGFVGIYFLFTDNVAGWTKPQFFLLIGLFRAIEGIYHVFFHQNLMNFPENITSGNFDLYITRPVNSLFLISTRYHSLDELGTFIIGLGLVFYALVQLHLTISLLIMIKILIMIFFGTIALYSIMLILSSLSFYLTRMTALFSIWDVISKALRVPINIITRDNFLGNALLFPLLIVVTIPSKIIFGPTYLRQIIIEIIGSVSLVILAYRFFYSCLRRYSSASS
jgi:ABC-2 type transport system permease protein